MKLFEEFMVKKILFVIVLVGTFTSCKTFSSLSVSNITSSKDGYIAISNRKLPFESLTYGDFRFAYTESDFNEINQKNKPVLKQIILYAKTDRPEYEYYIVEGKLNHNNHEEYLVKSIVINGKNITLAISKNAPIEDSRFLLKHFMELDDDKSDLQNLQKSP